MSPFKITLALSTGLIVASSLGLLLAPDAWWGYWPQVARSSLTTMSVWLIPTAAFAGAYISATPGRERFRYLLDGTSRPAGSQWTPSVRGGLVAILIPGLTIAGVLCVAALGQVGYIDVRIIGFVTSVVLTAAFYVLGHVVGRRVRFSVAVSVLPISLIVAQLYILQLPDWNPLYALSLIGTPSTAFYVEPWAPAALRLGMAILMLVVAWALHRGRKTLLQVASLGTGGWLVALMLTGAGQPEVDTWAVQPLCTQTSVVVCTDQAHQAVAGQYFETVGRLSAQLPRDLLPKDRIDANPTYGNQPEVMIVPINYGNSTESLWMNRASVGRAFAEAVVNFRCTSNSSALGAMLKYRLMILLQIDPNGTNSVSDTTLSQFESLNGVDRVTLGKVLELSNEQLTRVLASRQELPDGCSKELDELLSL